MALLKLLLDQIVLLNLFSYFDLGSIGAFKFIFLLTNCLSRNIAAFAVISLTVCGIELEIILSEVVLNELIFPFFWIKSIIEKYIFLASPEGQFSISKADSLPPWLT